MFTLYTLFARKGRSHSLTFDSDNMQSWHGHFSNKYIICGELVEDPKFEPSSAVKVE